MPAFLDITWGESSLPVGSGAKFLVRPILVDFEVNFTTDTVAECPLAEPLCVEHGTSVRSALEQMKVRNAAAVLICRGATLDGIFTERDALKMMAAGASVEVPIDQVMTANPVVLKMQDSVGRAITAMTKGGYRRLPIVDDAGRPTGMIKVESILHYLAEHFPKVVYNLPPEPHHSTRDREGA